MKKQCEVIMLTTKKRSQIMKHIAANDFAPLVSKETPYDSDNGEVFQTKHIFIVSTDTIKLNDWYFVYPARTDEYGIFQAKTERLVELCNENINITKVIASTDHDLNLPRPSDEFLKAYIKAGGIEDVMVEYEDHPTLVWKQNDLKLKVAPDNTITITRVIPKRTIYSEEDMKKAFEAGEDLCAYQEGYNSSIKFENFEQFINSYNGNQ